MTNRTLHFALLCALAAPLSAAPASAQGGKDAAKAPAAQDQGGGSVEMDPKSFEDAFLQTLDEKVSLNADQEKKIREALEASYKRSEKDWKRKEQLEAELLVVGKRLGDEIRRMYEEVREHLSFEQREVFDELRVDMRRKPVIDAPAQAKTGGEGGDRP